MLRRRGNKGRRAGKRLIDEVESFLAGRALDRYRSTGATPPAWAEINWLAHGEPSDILDRVRYELGLKRLPGSWPWAVSTLAQELFVDAGARTETIRRLQRDCLIPMEMALMRHAHQDFPPEHFVALGVPRLRAHPSARRPRPDTTAR
jgi:hypothetical protein